MYVPPAFAEHDTARLHAAIRAAGLVTLVTVAEDGTPFATPLPMLLEDEPAPLGALLGHVARANPHAKADGSRALVIFAGPDAYVSPSAYATKRETGRVVPTWNYVAIHAVGTLHCFEDPALLHDAVHRLTTHHERARENPWAVADAPRDFTAAQLRGITGVRVTIERLIGKWKMSQNRTEVDRAGVIAMLGDDAPDVAALIPR